MIRNQRLSWCMVLVVLVAGTGWAECPEADLTGDCVVDMADFAVFAAQWLDSDVPLPAPPDGMAWVYVDDPGVSGYDPFTGYMSKYETTNGQYCQYLNAAYAAGAITVYNDVVYASNDTDYSRPFLDTYAADTDSQITYAGGVFSVRSRDGHTMSEHPVVQVSFWGALAFANYYGWRLPTEWEWQAVADYDGSYNYGCGIGINPNKANYDQANPLGLVDEPYTTPMGYFGSYGYGMVAMAGSVWEWTSSWYDYPNTYNVVLRGGSWFNIYSHCAVSYQASASRESATPAIGFRVCRDQ